MRKEMVGFALGALVVMTSLGAAMVIRDDGLMFPDTSIQTTAAILPAQTAVQGEGSAVIAALSFCSASTPIYSVPMGKRLAIEWLSIRYTSPANAAPVEVNMTTYRGMTAILHPLVRLNSPLMIDGSFFFSDRYQSVVRLYSDGGQDVSISGCRDLDPNEELVITVTFSGHLVDA